MTWAPHFQCKHDKSLLFPLISPHKTIFTNSLSFLHFSSGHHTKIPTFLHKLPSLSYTEKTPVVNYSYTLTSLITADQWEPFLGRSLTRPQQQQQRHDDDGKGKKRRKKGARAYMRRHKRIYIHHASRLARTPVCACEMPTHARRAASLERTRSVRLC